MWKESKRRRHPEGGYIRDTVANRDRLPADSDVAIVSDTNLPLRAQILRIELVDEVEEHTHTLTTPTTLQEQLKMVPDSLQWAIKDIQLPADNGSAIAEAIQTGNGKCMSDGSLNEDFGTSAFVALTKNKEDSYEGKNCVPGEDDEQSSYRSELCGILGNAIVMNAICQLHHVTEPCEMIVGCDNEAALWNAYGETELSAQMASVDIVAAIREQTRMSPLRWIAKWVKGHQDSEQTDIPILDEWAHANIRCDALANEKWTDTTESVGHQRPAVGVLPGEGWTLWINDRKRSTNLDKALYTHAQADTIIHYWAKIGRLSDDTSGLIDWQGHKAAMKAFRNRQIWLAKHFSGWGGSGVMMARRKERDKAACHKCGEPETTIHTVRCQHKTSTDNYAALRKPMKQWLKKTTSLAIMKAVLCHLDAYQQCRQVVETSEFPTSLKIAAVYQATIGPRSFGEGLLSTHWRVVQKQHCLQKGGHETSKRWVSKLIQHLWEISWDMWDKRNDEIHSSAEVRRELYAGGITGKINALKEQSRFSLCLSKAERDFFDTPIATITRKRERSQLEWIARGEQFLSSTRLSMRLQNSRGMLYRWLASDEEPQHKRQRLITDHTVREQRQDTGIESQETTETTRLRVNRTQPPPLRQTTILEIQKTRNTKN